MFFFSSSCVINEADIKTNSFNACTNQCKSEEKPKSRKVMLLETRSKTITNNRHYRAVCQFQFRFQPNVINFSQKRFRLMLKHWKSRGGKKYMRETLHEERTPRKKLVKTTKQTFWCKLQKWNFFRNDQEN